mmetsp:Transcript_53775/g.79928  ORF Transcript_53775/g.79928 Transcript_53775/m.79928 type:complete len:227 (-) Transcript_53775:15-695(-)
MHVTHHRQILMVQSKRKTKQRIPHKRYTPTIGSLSIRNTMLRYEYVQVLHVCMVLLHNLVEHLRFQIPPHVTLKFRWIDESHGRSHCAHHHPEIRVESQIINRVLTLQYSYWHLVIVYIANPCAHHGEQVEIASRLIKNGVLRNRYPGGWLNLLDGMIHGFMGTQHVRHNLKHGTKLTLSSGGKLTHQITVSGIHHNLVHRNPTVHVRAEFFQHSTDKGQNDLGRR